MKTRIPTKFGMATVVPVNDLEFVLVIFDSKVALNGGLSCAEWLVTRDKLESFRK